MKDFSNAFVCDSDGDSRSEEMHRTCNMFLIVKYGRSRDFQLASDVSISLPEFSKLAIAISKRA